MTVSDFVGQHGFVVGGDDHRYVVSTLRALLKIWHEFAGNHQVTYWADYGTLIGVHRHQDMIPWDDDIDLGVLDKHWEVVERAWQESADSERPYLHKNGENWGCWVYKPIELDGKPLLMLKLSGVENWVKLKFADEKKFDEDISGLDLYRKELLQGIPEDRISQIIVPHPFGSEEIMAPLLQYAEERLCTGYGGKWADWQAFLKAKLGWPKNSAFQDISLDTLEAYYRSTRQDRV